MLVDILVASSNTAGPTEQETKPSIAQLNDFNVGELDPDLNMLSSTRKYLVLTPVDSEIDWLINFKCQSPYTFIGPDDTFKIINAGPLLVSLVPDDSNRDKHRNQRLQKLCMFYIVENGFFQVFF